MELNPSGTDRVQDSSRRKCIIVSGMHRSGTSALTRALNLLGAALPRRLMAANEFNPKGYFESGTLSALNDDILAELDSSWLDIADLHCASLDPQKRADLRLRITRAVDDEYPEASLLVIKDPRICRMLPLWREALAERLIDVCFALPVRHPLEVAGSLHRRDGLSLATGSLMWLRHVLQAEFETRDAPRVFVHYRDLLAAPVSTVTQMASALGATHLVSSPETDSAIGSFIDPALRHHSAASGELEQANAFYPWLKQTYEAYDRLVADPFDPAAQRELDDVRDRFDRASDTFLPLMRAQRHSHEAAAAKLRQETDEATVKISEATVRAADATAQAAEATARAAASIAQAEAMICHAQAIEKDAAITEACLAERERQMSLLKADIEALHASTSWRVTAPLRALKRSFIAR